MKAKRKQTIEKIIEVHCSKSSPTSGADRKITSSKLIDVQEKSIDEAAIWLKNNIDKNVYVKYLFLVNKYGTSRQVDQAIDKTLNYLTKHSDIVTILTTYLTLVENRGTERQIQKAIDKSLLYLTNTSEQISSAWQKYLVIIEKYASLDVRNYVIKKVIEWLELNPEDSQVRQKYISLVDKKGTLVQKKAVIITMGDWLEQHPEDKNTRRQYFSLIENYGTPQQKRSLIEKTLIWLQNHNDDTEIRRNLFSFIKNNLQYLENPYQVFNQTINWILTRTTNLSSSFWFSFLTAFHTFLQDNFYPSYQIKEIVNLALLQHPDEHILMNLIFSRYRDCLDYNIAYNLADTISNIPLEKIPPNQQQNIIIAGNFFRDYGIFTKAKECYSKIFMEILPVDIDELEPTEKTQNTRLEIIKSKSKRNTNLAQAYKKNLDAIYLGYAYLLILENPLNAGKASQYLYMVLENNPQHSFALWQLALSYESRGKEFFDKAIEFYSKAMLFDRRSTGRLSYEFGRFQAFF